MLLFTAILIANTPTVVGQSQNIRAFNAVTKAVQDVIYRSQHPIDCANKSWVTHARRSGAGIGSEIHSNGYMLAWAIDHNAIFVWNWSQWMTSSWCTTPTFECVFLTPTNCTHLDPKRQLPSPNLSYGTAIPSVFRNISFAPYTPIRWWTMQAMHYLLKFNARYAAALAKFKATPVYHSLSVPCGSVCVYVRHGDKGYEMELLPWSRFRAGIVNAYEISALTYLAPECKSANFSVFLMTDDEKVVQDARKDLGARLLHVNGSTDSHGKHPGVRNSTAEEKMETFNYMMLNVEYCIQVRG